MTEISFQFVLIEGQRVTEGKYNHRREKVGEDVEEQVEKTEGISVLEKIGEEIGEKIDEEIGRFGKDRGAGRRSERRLFGEDRGDLGKEFIIH